MGKAKHSAFQMPLSGRPERSLVYHLSYHKEKKNANFPGEDEIIAEIDQATADMLIGAASFGIGRIRRQQQFQETPSTDMFASAARSYLFPL
jgi:hypothetical protein